MPRVGSTIARNVAQWWVSKRKGSLAILEQQIGDSIPDVLVLEKRGLFASKPVLIAFEVKSLGDKLERVTKQCKYYLNWASYVYVVVEEDGTGVRIERTTDLLEPLKGIGIVIADGGFSIVQPPLRNTPTFSGLEWWVRKEFLVKELQSLGLRVSNKQPKYRIVEALRKINNNGKEALSKAIIATILSRCQILQYASRSFQNNS